MYFGSLVRASEGAVASSPDEGGAMMRGGVLVVLAEATEAGLLEAAEMRTRGLDPLLRPWIRRRVGRAVLAARTRTTVETPEHILKLAFLSVAPGAPEVKDPNDVVEVAAAYAPLAASLLKNRINVWPLSIAILAVVLGCASFTLIRYFLPTGEERFRGTSLGQALQGPLTEWVVAMDANQSQQAALQRWQIVSPLVLAQVGVKPHASLGSVLDAAEAAHVSEEPTTGAAFEPLMSALNVLNSSLASSRVPAYLSAYGRGEPGRRVVWLASYYARKRDDIAMEGVHSRATWGVRLDYLNLADSVAFKLDAEDATLLSLDRLEEELIHNWLRPIGRDEAMAEAATLSRDQPGGIALSRSLGPLVGNEIAEAAHLSKEEAKTIASLIENRNTAAAELNAKGYRIALRERLSLDHTTGVGLERLRGQEPQIDEILKQEALLGSYVKALSPAVDLLAMLVEEEFVAHLAETSRLRDTPVPALAEVALDVPAFRGRVSAELAKLARPQACPKLALWRTARLAFSDEFSHEVHGVGRVVLDALFKQLGLPGGSAWEGEGLEGRNLPRVLQSALEKPSAEVRAAAARAYEDVFRVPPPRFAREELR
jgi:hypothetical protein